MNHFVYFAFGSNMLSERLIKRCPSARPIGTAIAPNHFLCFDKRSIDGSGKATLVSGDGVKQKTWGVLFRISENERNNLDKVEGKDYRRNDEFLVLCSEHGERIIVSTYLAEKCDGGLVPYDWYHAIILAGAIQHKLPKEYISTLQRVASKLDPNPDRPKRQEALKILNSSGFDYLLEANT